MLPLEVSSKSLIWPPFWTLTCLPPRLFPSPVSVSIALFFPLKPLVCIWRYLAQQAYRALPQSQQLWHGLRIFALDSTTLRMPEALWPIFGFTKGTGAGPAQSRVAILYDLHARLPVRCKVGHILRQQDKHLIQYLLSSLGMGTLLVFDAGFYSQRIFLQLLKKKIHFLVPLLPQAKPKQLKSFGTHDGLYQIQSKRVSRRKKVTVRIIVVFRKGFRPRRLATSLLDPLIFPTHELAGLYHERWHIETFFREFKHTLSAQSWHANKTHAFYVELIFFMLLSCLTRLVMAQSGKDPSKLSFGKSLNLVRRMLDLSACVPVACWEKLYKQLLQWVASYEIDVRPHRSFERLLSKRRLRNRRLYDVGEFSRVS